MVDTLLDMKCVVDKQMDHGFTALVLLVKTEQLATLKRLINSGSNPH